MTSQFGFQPLHDLGVSFFHTSKIPAKTVLIQFFMCFAVPQAAGIRADLVSQNDRTVSKTHEKLDKDRFRRDLGGVEEAYAEIMKRLEAKLGG